MSFAAGQQRVISWGVDPAAGGFALAVIGPDARVITEVKWTMKKPKEMPDSVRLHMVFEEAREAMDRLKTVYPPDIIALEKPISSGFPNMLLDVGFAAVSLAASEVAGEAAVWMTPTEWRKAAGTDAWKEAGRALVDSLPFDVYPPRHDVRVKKRSTKPSSVAQAQSLGPTQFDVDLCEARLIGVAGVRQLGVSHEILPAPGTVVG